MNGAGVLGMLEQTEAQSLFLEFFHGKIYIMETQKMISRSVESFPGRASEGMCALLQPPCSCALQLMLPGFPRGGHGGAGAGAGNRLKAK